MKPPSSLSLAAPQAGRPPAARQSRLRGGQLLDRFGRGFTLVECSVVCAIVAIMASIAVPSFQGRELRMARLDAVEMLTRVQVEQEKYRSLHGMYATELSALSGVAATSAQGRYSITLERTAGEAYRAAASAQGVQAKDRECPAVVLEVSLGFPTHGPKATCWNQ